MNTDPKIIKVWMQVGISVILGVFSIYLICQRGIIGIYHQVSPEQRKN